MTTTKSYYEKFYPDAYRLFALDTAEHKMTVIQDNGLYRHLRFRKPGTGMYGFDIITWPGSLVIKGDMGTYLFSRTEDMFEFFGTGDMNPGYWAEKTPGYGRKNESIKTYDAETVRGYIASYIEDAVSEAAADAECEHDDVEDVAIATSKYRRRLMEHINSELFPDTVDYFNPSLSEEEMHQALADFEFEGREFWSDTWEWDLTTYTHQFLWCCLAIPYAIRTYRSTKEN